MSTTITLKDVQHYFGYGTLQEFAKDWKALSEADRHKIKAGIADGTYDYVAG